MGIKSGSRDAGLDDAADDREQATDQETTATNPASTEAGTAVPTDTATDSVSDTPTESTSQRPTMETIPYKLRRAKVSEGREQVAFFLRTDIIDGEDELQDTLEERLGEDVYKSDYREAAMVVAQRTLRRHRIHIYHLSLSPNKTN